MTDERRTFATLLVDQRRQRGESQAVVAKRAGISPVFLSQLECGERLPSAETVDRLAVALDMDRRALLRAMIEARYPESAALFSQEAPCYRCVELNNKLISIRGIAG